MKSKSKIPFFIYTVLTVMTVAGIMMCLFWLPNAMNYMAKFLPLPALRWICGVISIPFFSILLSAFVFPKAIANDTVFSSKTARWILGISIALLVDCILLCAASVWLLCTGEVLLSPVLLFVALIGITVAVMLFILSRYVDRAAILKEEADATL